MSLPSWPAEQSFIVRSIISASVLIKKIPPPHCAEEQFENPVKTKLNVANVPYTAPPDSDAVQCKNQVSVTAIADSSQLIAPPPNIAEQYENVTPLTIAISVDEGA